MGKQSRKLIILYFLLYVLANLLVAYDIIGLPHAEKILGVWAISIVLLPFVISFARMKYKSLKECTEVSVLMALATIPFLKSYREGNISGLRPITTLSDIPKLCLICIELAVILLIAVKIEKAIKKRLASKED